MADAGASKAFGWIPKAGFLLGLIATRTVF
jgi:hypothetical protein